VKVCGLFFIEKPFYLDLSGVLDLNCSTIGQLSVYDLDLSGVLDLNCSTIGQLSVYDLDLSVTTLLGKSKPDR